MPAPPPLTEEQAFALSLQAYKAGGIYQNCIVHRTKECHSRGGMFYSLPHPGGGFPSGGGAHVCGECGDAMAGRREFDFPAVGGEQPVSEQTAGCKLIAEAKSLYERRMHAPDGTTIREDNRIDGILTIDLPGWVERAERAEAKQRDLLREIELHEHLRADDQKRAEQAEAELEALREAVHNRVGKTIYRRLIQEDVREALKPRATDGGGGE